MSKYYKAEDIFALLDRLHNVSDGGIYYAIESLPTIEIENKCDTCCMYDIGFNDGRLDMLEKLSNALMPEGKNEQSD